MRPHMNAALPSPLELQVLSVLWERGDSTVREVLENLPDGKDRAYTTALSVLQTMERKKLVSRKTAEKAHVYRARKTEKQILVPKIKEEIANVFGGSSVKFIAFALDAVSLTEDEKKELTALLRDQKTKTPPKSKAAKKKTPAQPKAAPKTKAPAKVKTTAKTTAKKSTAKKSTATKKAARRRKQDS